MSIIGLMPRHITDVFPSCGREDAKNFKELVKECMSPALVLTKERVEKFAAMTRAYICTYQELLYTRRSKDLQNPSGVTGVPLTLTVALSIQFLKKK